MRRKSFTCVICPRADPDADGVGDDLHSCRLFVEIKPTLRPWGPGRQPRASVPIGSWRARRPDRGHADDADVVELMVALVTVGSRSPRPSMPNSAISRASVGRACAIRRDLSKSSSATGSSLSGPRPIRDLQDLLFSLSSSTQPLPRPARRGPQTRRRRRHAAVPLLEPVCGWTFDVQPENLEILRRFLRCRTRRSCCHGAEGLGGHHGGQPDGPILADRLGHRCHSPAHRHRKRAARTHRPDHFPRTRLGTSRAAGRTSVKSSASRELDPCGRLDLRQESARPFVPAVGRRRPSQTGPRPVARAKRRDHSKECAALQALELVKGDPDRILGPAHRNLHGSSAWLFPTAATPHPPRQPVRRSRRIVGTLSSLRAIESSTCPPLARILDQERHTCDVTSDLRGDPPARKPCPIARAMLGRHHHQRVVVQPAPAQAGDELAARSVHVADLQQMSL